MASIDREEADALIAEAYSLCSCGGSVEAGAIGDVGKAIVTLLGAILVELVERDA